MHDALCIRDGKLTPLQAEVMLAGCIAYGLVRIDAALSFAAGYGPWVEALLGRPSPIVPPGELGLCLPVLDGGACGYGRGVAGGS